MLLPRYVPISGSVEVSPHETNTVNTAPHRPLLSRTETLILPTLSIPDRLVVQQQHQLVVFCCDEISSQAGPTSQNSLEGGTNPTTPTTINNNNNNFSAEYRKHG